MILVIPTLGFGKISKPLVEIDTGLILDRAAFWLKALLLIALMLPARFMPNMSGVGVLVVSTISKAAIESCSSSV